MPLALGRQPAKQRVEATDGELLATAAAQCQPGLEPNPIATLQHVSGFAGGAGPAVLHWVAGGEAEAPEEVVFAAGSLIVSMQPASGTQRHLLGHSRAVTGIALSCDGSRLASVEEGAGAALRLWHFRQAELAATVPGHVGGTVCLDLSPSGNLLATAGVDAQGRQEFVVWDVTPCWAADSGAGGSCKPVELARQASDYNIQCIRFVPHDASRLVTCGKNSIRIHRYMQPWHLVAPVSVVFEQPGSALDRVLVLHTRRLSAGQLRGVSVPMDGVQALQRRPYSCGTLASHSSTSVGEVFTCLAWEHTQRVRPLEAQRLYVGGLSGGRPAQPATSIAYWHVQLAWDASKHARDCMPAGAVYTVCVERRAVEAVAQAHPAAVCSLAVHDGFCVTGSADRLLRMWGSDVREVYMEARHDSAVTGGWV